MNKQKRTFLLRRMSVTIRLTGKIKYLPIEGYAEAKTVDTGLVGYIPIYELEHTVMYYNRGDPSEPLYPIYKLTENNDPKKANIYYDSNGKTMFSIAKDV